MGIHGLLPLLKSIMVPIHIKDLEGCCVAVDTYSWLHKGALSCSKELCKGLPTSKHIDYCMYRVNLLRHYGVKPVLVFDGGLLPMKSEQENKRARSRKENLARAMEHESNGNSAAAYECYQKAVDISPSVAYELIQVLKRENVCYVVAPYEADAQMTFLAASKQVDAVITEDSDLIAFGCPRIIYKMDKYGQAVEFHYSTLEKNKGVNFTGFNKQMLLEMCILSGCDYLQSLPGMGLKKAYALMKKFKSYDKIIKHMKYSGIAVSPLYEESFRKAILTFQHQRVFDLVSEDIVYLSELPDNVGEDLDFLGPLIPQHIAKGIARGDLDPLTKMPFQQGSVTAVLALDGTYKLKKFRPNDERRKVDLPAQKNLLTNYFCFASLEAKRKFRAPRVTPKPPNPVNLSSSPGDDVNEEADSFHMNFSSAILPNSGNLGIGPPKSDITDNDVITKASLFQNSVGEVIGKMRSPEHALLQQSEHSMRKRCIPLYKEHEGSYASDAGEGKTRTENRNVTVKSRYFEHKSVKENDHEGKNENMSVNDSAANDMHDNAFSEQEYNASETGPGKMIIEKTNIQARSSCFQQKYKKNDQNNNNEKYVFKDYPSTESGGTICGYEYKSASDKAECKTRTETRKVNMKSAYFEHKTVRENDQENTYEKLPLQGDFATSMCENVIPGDKHLKGTITKRKVAFVENDHAEIANHKRMRTDSSFPIQNKCISNLDDSDIKMNSEQGMFGCNISHLCQYSKIAEKSMENFVSVLSTFRCTSSGSRASGLRAPLKDVRNTCAKKY